MTTYRNQRNPPQVPLLNFLSYFPVKFIFARTFTISLQLFIYYLCIIINIINSFLFYKLVEDFPGSFPRIQFYRALFFASVISIAWFPITVHRWPVARMLYMRAPGNISETPKKKERQTVAIYKPIWCHVLHRPLFISLSLFSSFTRINEVQKVKFIDANKILYTRILVSPKHHFYNATGNKWLCVYLE